MNYIKKIVSKNYQKWGGKIFIKAFTTVKIYLTNSIQKTKNKLKISKKKFKK